MRLIAMTLLMLAACETPAQRAVREWKEIAQFERTVDDMNEFIGDQLAKRAAEDRAFRKLLAAPSGVTGPTGKLDKR